MNLCDCNDHSQATYQRLDLPASDGQRAILKGLKIESVNIDELAGEPVIQKFTRIPGSNLPLDGLKVVTENGWFAVRPSGTESINKFYAESFRDAVHLKQIQEDTQGLLTRLYSDHETGSGSIV